MALAPSTIDPPKQRGSLIAVSVFALACAALTLAAPLIAPVASGVGLALVFVQKRRFPTLALPILVAVFAVLLVAAVFIDVSLLATRQGVLEVH